MAQAHCTVCRRYVTPIRPSFRWTLAVAGAAVFCLALVTGAVFLGMGLLLSAPLVAVLGLSAVGPLAARAAETPRCPHCERYVSLAAGPVAEPVAVHLAAARARA